MSLSRPDFGASRGLRLALALVVAALAARRGEAQGVTIEHEGVACIVANRFPELGACLDPASALARGRIYFQAEGTPRWYFVDLKPGPTCFAGILPRPNPSTAAIRYYIETVDRDFAANRTPDYVPVVVKDAKDCPSRSPVAKALRTAVVKVGSAGGGTLVPAGFAAAGIAGAAGGSTVVATAAVVGAGAAVAGVAVATTGGDAAVAPSTTAVGNRAPNVLLSVTPEPPAGEVALVVRFNLCRSTDPDPADVLRFRFDFGDGSADEGSCQAEHTYTRAGDYEARACVSDGTQEICRSVVVRAGTSTGPSTPPSSTTPPPPPSSTTPGCEKIKPTVSITSPADRSTVSGTVTITANAEDNVGVSRVEFSIDSTLLRTVTSPPYSVAWDTRQVPNGEHRIRVKAYDACDNDDDADIEVDVANSGGLGLSSTSGPRMSRAGSVAWTSDLRVREGAGHLVLNARPLGILRGGPGAGIAETRPGENLLEAELFETSGPGTWRFDVQGPIEPGSLRPVTGDVVAISERSITFRLAGRPGERVRFVFRAAAPR